MRKLFRLWYTVVLTIVVILVLMVATAEAVELSVSPV